MSPAATNRTHLSKAEMVDFAEGGLASARMAHVNACGTCREEAEAFRALLGEVGEVSAPEPSPLFWSHLAKRVAEAVSRDSSGPRLAAWRWRGLSHVATAVATATVVLAVVVGVSVLRGPDDDLGFDVVTDDLGLGVDGLDDAADWTLLLAVAESVDWMEAETDLLSVDRQTVEEAVFALSDDERRTLVQLLEAELQGSLGL